MRHLIAALLLIPAAAGAQQRGATQQSVHPVFERAVTLVGEGRGQEGRRLVDSVLTASREGSEVWIDALFWRGALAESEDVSEKSFTQLVTEYPLSRRAEESLIRLAQLNMTRGERATAQRFLDRIIVEHPYGRYRAQASYWRARLFFEVSETDRACAELGTARMRVQDSDIELRNEIDFMLRNCPAVPPANAGGARAADSGRGAQSQGRSAAAADSGGRAGGSTGRAAAAGGSAGRGGANTNTVTASDSGNAAGGRGSGAAADSSGARGRQSGDSSARGTGAGRGQQTEPPTVMFTVQAAAFPARETAESFVEALKGRGYEARLFGTSAPFRVRLGMFPTREEATALAEELKTKRIASDAFVTEAEGSGGRGRGRGGSPAIGGQSSG